MSMPYVHNDIFLSDSIGYDKLKFSQIYTPRKYIPGYTIAREFTSQGSAES